MISRYRIGVRKISLTFINSNVPKYGNYHLNYSKFLMKVE
jgi:hypothetical protein